jgi:prephenate dehydrogenase
MAFNTVAIVGVGLIGGSIGMAVRQRRLARRVVGIGRHQRPLSQARRLGAIDQGTTQMRRGVSDAELIVVCTPVDTIVSQAISAAESCPAGAILTDSGSTKARIVERLENELADRVGFVGSHPLAGSERTGVAVARPDLFEHRVCVITRTPRTPKQPLAAVDEFWRSLGAIVRHMSPESHDHALAYTSHLPHLTAAALSVLLPEEYKEVVATGFRDTTRIAASDPALWSAIFMQNTGPLLKSLDGYERVLREFRKALVTGDARKVEQLWRQSQAKRIKLDGRAT